MSRRPPRRGSRAPVLLLAAVALLSATVVAGCGNGDDETSDDELVNRVIVDPEDIPAELITAEDRKRFPENSVERAAVDYWSALQFGDLATAGGFYEPGLRRSVGNDLLLTALQNQQALYRARKPSLIETVQKDGLSTVRYVVADLAGTELLQSLTMRRLGADWAIVFSSSTGSTIQSLVQAQEQARIDPAAELPPPKAVEAGNDAAARQLDFLSNALSG